MRLRAIVIGVVLGLLISASAYYVECVIKQTFLINDQMPVVVFGVVAVLMLLANPVLRLVNWEFRPAELAVIAALGLAVCGWPGGSFMRGFTSVVMMPSHWVQVKPAWQQDHVMSYVPGGSAELAPGFVTDWTGLSRRLADGRQPAAPPALRRIYSQLPPNGHSAAARIADSGKSDPTDRRVLLNALNEEIHASAFYDAKAFGELSLPARAQQLRRQLFAAAPAPPATTQPVAATQPAAPATSTAMAQLQAAQRQAKVERLNRAVLHAALPEYILPQPRGSGALLAGGRSEPIVVNGLIHGYEGKAPLTDYSAEIWRTWWPTLRLWGGIGLLIGIASMCLALIVHPQWSKRELLAYPIAQFFEELISPRSSTASLTKRGDKPHRALSRMFWWGMATAMFIHLINGLNVWFPGGPSLPLHYNFNSLVSLIPGMRQAPSGWALFNPTIYLSVVGLAYFLASEVAFSLGISQIALGILATLLLGYGVPLQNDWFHGNYNMMLFGAYVATGLVVLYIGRRYYLHVLGSTFGLGRWEDTPRYAVWGGRIFLLCMILCTYLLYIAGLTWWLAIFWLALVLLIFLVVGRIQVETGAIFIQPTWLPVGMLTALLGIEAIGPTAYIIMGIGSMILVADPRELVFPFLLNGLKIADDQQVKPQRIGPAMGVMVVVGLLVALAATITLQYIFGLKVMDNGWIFSTMPTWPFNALFHHIDDLASVGKLAAATAHPGLTQFHIGGTTLLWMGLGAALVVGCSVARIGWSWWPLHPVLFLVWGSYPGAAFAWTFLVGWAIKVGVVKVGGARAYQAGKPYMAGLITGEFLAAIAWLLVNVIFHVVTGVAPAHTYAPLNL